jgi:DNA repair protein RecO (recombination protein O)
MLEKTRGIILHRIKYSDSGLIVQLYTRKFGRHSFIIKGMRSRKSGKHNIMLEPLSIIDIETYYKPLRELQVIKEFSAAYIPSGIHSEIRKSCIAIFLGEVLTSVLKEESQFEEMFSFIESSIIYFDVCSEGFVNFHIAFLSGLSSYLGFEPGRQVNETDRFFDLLNGVFVPVHPVHGNYADPEISGILALFFRSTYEESSRIRLTGVLRNEVLETLLKYYSIHLPGLRNIKSLEVLKEVFR